MTRITLVLRAYSDLIAHDIFMSRHDFAGLLRRVKGFPLRRTSAVGRAVHAQGRRQVS